MNVLFTKQQAHDEIECVFRELLPQNGMAQRPEQIRLCHSMLDAMLDGSIALCDAGTGIGKTFAYLVAGIMLEKYRSAEGEPRRPVLISTSSIALQNAIPGDLVFYDDDEHVGIVGGCDENGDLLIIHCASGYNNVVITGLEGFTSIGRPNYYTE